MLQADVCDQMAPDTPINSVGEINWMLKSRSTNQIFTARQTHNQLRQGMRPALQSELRLISGDNYETLKVSSPAPQAKNLRTPEQEAPGSPSLGLSQGTHIMTEHGEIPIENLTPGIRLITRDHGMQRLRWIGASRRPQNETSLVRFHTGAISNCRDLVVCSNQHIVLKGADALMRFGKREVFAKAGSFVDNASIRHEPRQHQVFYQLLLDNHEVLYAEAAACESFLPSTANLSALPLASRLDIHLLLPDLQSNPQSFGPMARSRVDTPTRPLYA